MKCHQELRVACTKGMQRATLHTQNATYHATKTQPESLKALVERRFKCNQPRNSSATTPSKEAQLSTQNIAQKVARVAVTTDNFNNAIEAAEERAAIMEYDGGLPGAEAENNAIEKHLNYLFKCTDGGGVFRTQCETIGEVRKALEHRFGNKLIEVDPMR